MAGNVAVFTNDSFQKDVRDESGVVLVDFWASWCGPCQMLGPIIEELSDGYVGRVKMGKVNVDENQNLATEFQVVNIPTIIIFKNGQEQERLVGVKSLDDYEDTLDKYL